MKLGFKVCLNNPLMKMDGWGLPEVLSVYKLLMCLPKD